MGATEAGFGVSGGLTGAGAEASLTGGLGACARGIASGICAAGAPEADVAPAGGAFEPGAGGLGSELPGARRVTVGTDEVGRLFLKRAKAETRFLEGGVIEPSSCSERTAASCLRIPSLLSDFLSLAVFLSLGAEFFTGFLPAGALVVLFDFVINFNRYIIAI